MEQDQPQVQFIANIAELQKLVKGDKSSDSLLQSLIGFIFQSSERLEKVSNQCDKMPKAVCAGSIPMNELTYKCYDCGFDNQLHIYCEKCFLNGDHKGHRYLRSLDRSGCCDCGDESALLPSGFCKNHGGFAFLSNLNMSVDEDIEGRLDSALAMIFQEVFKLCDAKQFDANTPDKMQQTIELLQKIDRLLETIANFIEVFCKPKLPILFAVCKVLEKQRRFTLRHQCSCQTFEQTFGVDPKTTHQCNTTIIDLVFMYSIIAKFQKENLTRIFFTLFLNANFKKFLVDKYIFRFRFLTAIDPQGQELLVSELHNLFTQFFSQDLVLRILNNKYFIRNTFNTFSFYVKVLKNQKLYQQGHSGTAHVFHFLNYLQDRICAYKLTKQGFQILHNLLERSFEMTPVPEKTTMFHRYRLHCDYMVILETAQTMKIASFNDPNLQKYLADLVKLYASMLQKQDWEQYDQCAQWYGQPERIIGIALLAHLLKFGIESTKEMFNAFINSDVLEKICQKLYKRYNFCQQKLLSTYVGFLGELTEKDLVKFHYRSPAELVYDSDQLCMQMVALLSNPELFVKYFLENVLPQNQISLMLLLNTQESFAINMAEAGEVGSNPLLFESKKNYIINAFEKKKKMPVQIIKEVFEKVIFNSFVKLEEALAEVADYDKESGLYSLKKEYSDLMERIYLVRNNAVYSKLYQKIGDVSAEDFKLDNIIQKMASQNKPSVCSLVTENISKSIGFMSNFLCKSFRGLWEIASSSKDFKTNYAQLKLISVFLVRNASRPDFREFMEDEYRHISDKEARNPVQKILSQLMTGLAEEHKLPDLPLEKQSSRAAHRKRQILEEMKKKRKKFQEKHQVDAIQERKQSQDVQNKCLICHQETQQDMVITMHSIITQTLPTATYKSFGSCYHTFHLKCIAREGYDLCPLCRLPFSFALPQVYRKFDFHSKQKPLKLSLARNPEILQQIMMFAAFIARENETEQISGKNFEEFIVSRLQLSLLDSSELFFTRVLPCLKSLLCMNIMIKQPEKNVNKIKELQEVPDKEFIELIVKNKVTSYVVLITGLIISSLELQSTHLIAYYNKVISRFFNGFLAANMVSLYGRKELTEERIPDLFAQQKEVFYGQMTDFCRGVFYTASVVFNEDWKKAVETIDRDLAGVAKAIEDTPEFFQADLKMIANFIALYPETENNLFSQQSLLIQIQLIPLPKTYKQFHDMYYSKTCEKCNDYPRAKGGKAYLCLQCGFRGCNYDCTLTKSKIEFICSLHNMQKHCRQGAFIDVDNNQLYVCENAVAMTYGTLYENEFGESDPEKEKDWAKLVLDKAVVSRIITNMQKHTILSDMVSKIQAGKEKHLKI